MDKWIDDKLDEFFDKTGERHIDMIIFTEIFDKLATPEYKINQPELYKSEVGRIRDLHNSFTYAFEKGREKEREIGRRLGRKKAREEAAKELLNEGFKLETIMEITNLNQQEIENLKS